MASIIINKNLPLIELQDAARLIKENVEADSVLLNFNETFDLNTEKSSKKYDIVNTSERANYIKNILSKKRYSYEDDELPKNEELIILFEKSLNRLKSKANEISFSEKI